MGRHERVRKKNVDAQIEKTIDYVICLSLSKNEFVVTKHIGFSFFLFHDVNDFVEKFPFFSLRLALIDIQKTDHRL